MYIAAWRAAVVDLLLRGSSILFKASLSLSFLLLMKGNQVNSATHPEEQQLFRTRSFLLKAANEPVSRPANTAAAREVLTANYLYPLKSCGC